LINQTGLLSLKIKYDETVSRIIKVGVAYATDARQNDKDDHVCIITLPFLFEKIIQIN
jgi:hypothetical protein